MARSGYAMMPVMTLAMEILIIVTLAPQANKEHALMLFTDRNVFVAKATLVIHFIMEIDAPAKHLLLKAAKYLALAEEI